MEGKNLFIGICTENEYTIKRSNLKKCHLDVKSVKAKNNDFKRKTSDWIIQEIGYALGRKMDLLLLLENTLSRPGGLQGDVEHISFNRIEPEKTFKKILEMITCLMPKKEITKVGQVEKPFKQEEKKELKITEEKETQDISNDWDEFDYEHELILAVIKKDKGREEELTKNFISNKCKQDEYKQISWEAHRLYYHFIFLNEDVLQKVKDLLSRNPNDRILHSYIGEIYEDYKNYKMAVDHYKLAVELEEDNKIKINRLCKLAVSYSKYGDSDLAKLTIEKAKNIGGELENGELTILHAYFKISEIENQDVNFVIFGEGLVSSYSRRSRYKIFFGLQICIC